MYIPIKKLQLMFDIGNVEYSSFRRLSNETRMIYIRRFLKKGIEVSEFDEFVSGYGYKSEEASIVVELVAMYGINLPDNFRPYDSEKSKEWRLKNVQFDRTVKLKLLETWEVDAS